MQCDRLMLMVRSEERFSRNAETDLVCRLLLEKKNALRRLDLSRSRDPLARAPRVAHRVAAASRARLHHVISFSAPTGGRRRGPRAERNRALVATPPAPRRFRSRRRHGALL